MRFPIPCVIFAGGKSSRMGRDKALLPFGGYPTLAEYQYRRLLPLFSRVYLSTKSEKFPFDALLILDDEAAETFAPTAGLLGVYGTLQSDFFVLPVDTPFVDEAIMERLFEAYEEGNADAVIARTPRGAHPLCGIYTSALLPKLQEMVRSGNHRLNHLLRISRTRYVDFPDEAPFFNINTPDDYESGLSATPLSGG